MKRCAERTCLTNLTYARDNNRVRELFLVLVLLRGGDARKLHGGPDRTARPLAFNYKASCRTSVGRGCARGLGSWASSPPIECQWPGPFDLGQPEVLAFKTPKGAYIFLVDF